jgi:hypothetical protein
MQQLLVPVQPSVRVEAAICRNLIDCGLPQESDGRFNAPVISVQADVKEIGVFEAAAPAIYRIPAGFRR